MQRKGLEAWLLASMRPWVQSPLPKNKRKINKKRRKETPGAGWWRNL
jgi:hypothetical protein